MLPLKDDIPSLHTPVITILLIVLNAIVFLYQASLTLSGEPQALASSQAFASEFGVTPCRLTGRCPAPFDFPMPALTVFTSMFVHGGLFHVASNMLYLWIFGDNVEDTLGRGRFLLLYFGSGVVAVFAQTMVNPASAVPMIGASGAVSGVLGAYLVLFPHAGVLTLIIFGFFIRIVRIPAVIVLGFWIVVQVVNGLVTYSASSHGHGAQGGVAFFAHVGGFVAGLVLLFLLRRRRGSRL